MRTPDEVVRALSAAESALLCMHVSPDGDTLGATLALGAALTSLGKRVRITCADPAPAQYAFLPGLERILAPAALAEERFDLAVSLDVSDTARLGSTHALFAAAPLRVVVDHHATNDRFGDINWIEPNASSTGVMIHDTIARLPAKLTPEIAEYLYVAIATDTGNFSYANTDADSLRAAADLVAAGARADRLIERIYRTRSYPSVAILGRALATLQLHARNRIATMTLTASDFAQTGASDGMTEGIINFAIEIVGVEVAALLRERDDSVKCSLRAKAPRDISALAKRLGGGGHALAAGCTLHKPMEDALRILVQGLEEIVD